MYTVYKHITPSEKVYVGITSLSVEKRWNNGQGYKCCTLFYKAIKKYGWSNIIHEIVKKDLTKDEACKLEQELIAQYQKQGRSYNCSTGGELTAYGCKRTEEFKRKLSEVNKGKRLAEETKRKLSVSHKGKPYKETPAIIEGRKRAVAKMRGRTFSIEHRANLSKAKKGKRTGSEHIQSIRVFCATTGKTYAGISEASRELNLDKSSICKVCKGKLKHYKGYTFRYESD